MLNSIKSRTRNLGGPRLKSKGEEKGELCAVAADGARITKRSSSRGGMKKEASSSHLESSQTFQQADSQTLILLYSSFFPVSVLLLPCVYRIENPEGKV